LAHNILIKRSATSTAVPTGGQLAAGELAINTADEKIFFKNSAGTVKALSAMSDLTSNLVTMSTTQTITGTKTFSTITTFNEHVVVGSKKELRFADSDSSNYVSLTSPTTLSNNNVYTLPSAVGSANQVLQIASVAGNDATLQWATVSATDSLTIAGDLAVNGGDITTSASTFSIATSATTVYLATEAGAASTLYLGGNQSNSQISCFNGGLLAVYTLSKATNSLFCGANCDDFGFYGAATSMGYGCTGITNIGDWEGSGNGHVIQVDDITGTITFYASGVESYQFPTTRGSNGQVLTTNGSGTLTWATGGGGSKTYERFTPLNNQPPATNFATIDTRNSIMVLDFADSSADESAVFVGVIPEGASLGSGLKVRIIWMATSATSGNVRWGAQFMNLNTDLDSDSFDTATEGNGAANGTSGTPTTTELTVTNIDGLAAGGFFRLKIYREQSDTVNDTMTGDAELIAVEVRSAS